MASGDTKTQQYLDVAANGTRADVQHGCCETRTQSLIMDVADRIITEEETRAREDQILQNEIDEIKNNPDVADIVPTYAALQDYDTSKLTDQDIIRVLADETHEGASTYYRWSTSSQTFTYVGETGDYYTKSQVNDLLDDKQDLLTAGDGITIEEESGALVISSTGGGGGTSNFNQLTNRPKYDNTAMTSSTNIPKVPTKTSELSNDSNFVTSGSLATVATTGAYSDLSGTPTIPVVNNATLTVTQNGTSVGTFTANSSTDTTIAVTDTTYSDFTGTDGSSVGVAGLVPAPATTDAGKFLKADGTWDTAGGGGGPTVVQTTGTSTTDVMSQNAVTSMVYADLTAKTRVQIGDNATAYANNEVVIGSGATSNSINAVALGPLANVGSNYSTAIGSSAIVNGSSNYSVALGYGATVEALKSHSVAIGSYSKVTEKGQVDFSTLLTSNTYGYNGSQYRLLTGLYDPQSAHDAATKGYVDTAVAGAAYDPTISNNTLYL